MAGTLVHDSFSIRQCAAAQNTKTPNLLGGQALPARVAIEEAVHRDHSGPEPDSYAAPGADARARLKSLAGARKMTSRKSWLFPSSPFRASFDPRDPDSRIDLVSSSSIDDTLSVFDESDVLTPSLFSVAPPIDGSAFVVFRSEI